MTRNREENAADLAREVAMKRLDDAQDEFGANPNRETAGVLLTVGLQYWHDEMITDETFDAEVVKPVRDWLSTPDMWD